MEKTNPEFNQINNLIKYCIHANERLQAPLIRFLADFYTLEEICRKTKLTSERVKYLVLNFSMYYSIQFNDGVIKINDICENNEFIHFR